MKFGIIYPNMGRFVDTELAVQLAAAAEDAGFEFLLTWDHYTLPDSKETFEAWMLLSHLAAKTSKIRLGTCVTPIPFRPPAVLAKMVATLDQLSGGRIVLGVGAGWHRPEFEAYGRWEDDSVRVAKTKEGLELILKLWREDRVDFRGKYYSCKDGVLEPKPVQKPHPPLWFGTTGDYMLKLAVRYGDGWIPTLISSRSYARYASRIRKMLESSGLTKSFSFAFDLYDPLHDVEDYVRSIEEFRGGGCEYYGINWKYRKEDWLDRIRWFAKNVMASYH